MATKERIKTRALIELGVLGRGQTPTAEQDAEMEAAYAEVYGRLSATDAVTWAYDEDIPDEVAPQMVALVAAARADHYSIPTTRLQRLAARSAMADSEIRHILEPTYQSTHPVMDF